MSEYACRRNLPSDLDQRRHVALARDVDLGRIGRIATLTEPCTEESFYVLDGAFTFTLGTDDVEAGPGSFIRVPRGTRHELRAAPGGGRLLTLWVPGGTEAMFVELSRMPPGSLRDPEVRKAISARFDSIPT
jgi:Cupin domain